MGAHLVTGAASGLGAAVTARLRDRGERVVTVDLRDADVIADLGTVDGRAGALERALALVDGPLAGLVPCAGLGPQVPDHGLIASVNFFGAVAFLDGCLDALATAAPSAAVAISSNSTTIDPTVDAALVAAFLARDEDAARTLAAAMPGNTVYASSKVAIARDVRRRVQDWGGLGVRINAVAPSLAMHPFLAKVSSEEFLAELAEKEAFGRAAEVWEIANVIVFLASDYSSYMTGEIVSVSSQHP